MMREHWEHVYAQKDPTQLSWYQREPARSLALIDESLAALAPSERQTRRIIDVGGGVSTLVEHLLDRPSVEICVMDIAGLALAHARRRLGERAARARWIEADVSKPIPEPGPAWADLWHDRAVYHFLTSPDQRAGYAANLSRILKPGGRAIIATFAPDGPPRCSGLDVCRHDGASIVRELGGASAGLSLVREEREDHVTPWGATQRFVYALIDRR